MALAEDGAEERAHFGNPDFRIGGKIFAGLQANGQTATLKLTPEVQAGLVDPTDEHATFYPAAGAWGEKGWTHVRLTKARDGMLRELLAEAASSVRKPTKKGSRAAEKGTPEGASKASRLRSEQNATRDESPRALVTAKRRSRAQ